MGSNKGLKEAEVKVIIISCCFAVLGLGATLAFAISSRSLDGIMSEVLDYFECELNGVNPDQPCERSGFERLLNPASKVIGYAALALYPVITLIYFIRAKRKTRAKRVLTQKTSSKSFMISSLNSSSVL